MKQKVNLRLVEGDENLVTKHEILYKKDIDQKIQLFKRNNKGLLEAITKGDWDNVVKLYPKDGNSSSVIDFMQNFWFLLGERNCSDYYFGKISKTNVVPFTQVYLDPSDSNNRKFIDYVADKIKSWCPEERGQHCVCLEGVDAVFNVGFVDNSYPGQYILYYYNSAYWEYLTLIQKDDSYTLECNGDVGNKIVFRSDLTKYASINQLLNVSDLSKAVVSSNTIECTDELMTDLFMEGVRRKTERTSYDQEIYPEGLHFVLYFIDSTTFVGDFYYLISKDDSAPMYVKGQIQGSKGGTITTKVTSVSN